MAKPIKKGKRRYSSGFNGKKIGKVILGILLLAAIIFGIYWIFQNQGTVSSTVSGNSLSEKIQTFFKNSGLQSSWLLIVAVGGFLFAYVFNKR